MFCHPFGLLSYSGTKSYQNLLVDVYGGTSESYANSALASIVFQSPFNFTRSGFRHFNRNDNGSDGSGVTGYFWLAEYYNSRAARIMYHDSDRLSPATLESKGFGFTVRCLVC